MVQSINLPSTFKNLSGQRFARLLCLHPVEIRKNRHVVYECICDCGTTKMVTSSNLKSDHTTSCGCWMREATSKANRRHGRSKTPAYRRWCQMIQRCHCEYAQNYKWYGARGISVCDRWRNSFESFLEDMGEAGPGMSIDRIDNDGPYAPWNCRWATQKEQTNNTRRKGVQVRFRGEAKSLSQWGRELGIKTETIRKRLAYGWSVERALSNQPQLRVSNVYQEICTTGRDDGGGDNAGRIG